jgi:hypothetical protein
MEGQGDRAMDGMLTTVVGAVDREVGPRPFATSDAMAARAVGEAHARRMAREAKAIAEGCMPAPAYDPDGAVVAAEGHHRAIERRRLLHADRLRGLWEAGRITAAQYRAADEIADMLAWLDAGKQVLARSQFSERLATTTGTLTMQQRLEEAERLRYGPWRAWAAGYPVKRDGSRTVEDLVRAFVVQRLGVEQVGCAFRMHRRRAEALLVRALRRYAVIGGWEAATETA